MLSYLHLRKKTSSGNLNSVAFSHGILQWSHLVWTAYSLQLPSLLPKGGSNSDPAAAVLNFPVSSQKAVTDTSPMPIPGLQCGLTAVVGILPSTLSSVWHPRMMPTRVTLTWGCFSSSALWEQHRVPGPALTSQLLLPFGNIWLLPRVRSHTEFTHVHPTCGLSHKSNS